jgi:transcriptional accessory protein Tex/SPT6
VILFEDLNSHPVYYSMDQDGSYPVYNDQLRRYFGDYLSADFFPAWENVKARLNPGETIHGKVVVQVHFGVFVDIGVGFPALISVTEFEHTGTRRFSTIPYPEVGCSIVARVVGFDERARRLALSQRSPHPWLEGRQGT